MHGCSTIGLCRPSLLADIDLDPGQALGTVDLDESSVGVDFAAAHLGTLAHARRPHGHQGGRGC
jgi:hypothetical protein